MRRARAAATEAWQSAGRARVGGRGAGPRATVRERRARQCAHRVPRCNEVTKEDEARGGEDHTGGFTWGFQGGSGGPHGLTPRHGGCVGLPWQKHLRRLEGNSRGKRGRPVMLAQQQWEGTVRPAGEDTVTLGKRVRASVRTLQTSHSRSHLTLAG